MKLPETFATTAYTINAVVETPRGSPNKYSYDPVNDLFRLKKILPSGTAFPFDFGFIPFTKAGDGDPLDVLIITEAGLCQGAVVECRVTGVLEAIQTIHNKKQRNDRIIAVAVQSARFSHLSELKDMNKDLLKDLVRFFEYYNTAEGKKFKVTAKKGPATAIELIKKQIVKELP